MIPIRPLVLSPEDTAQAIGLSLSLVQKMERQGDFPKARQLSSRRVGYLLSELEEWLVTRPESSCLPPENSGFGRAGKPA